MFDPSGSIPNTCSTLVISIRIKILLVTERIVSYKIFYIKYLLISLYLTAYHIGNDVYIHIGQYIVTVEQAITMLRQQLNVNAITEIRN